MKSYRKIEQTKMLNEFREIVSSLEDLKFDLQVKKIPKTNEIEIAIRYIEQLIGEIK